MRILHLDGGKELRGGQWQVLRLIEGLATEGVESTLLARRNSPLFQAARQKGWRVQPLGIARTALLAASHDLLHAHDGHGHTAGAMVRPSRLIVSRRVAFPPRSRVKFGRARRYIAISQCVKDVLVAGGVPESKISVVYDGVPLLEPAHGTSILAPATDDPQKGSALALDAARIAGVTLQFVGDLERQLPEAALFVYLTRSEGLGSAVLLAMSAGVPVIASRVGGLVEVVRDGENGFLVANNAAEIAAAIKRVTEDGELARRIGAAARQCIMERFTVENMVRRTMAIYHKVLA